MGIHTTEPTDAIVVQRPFINPNYTDSSGKVLSPEEIEKIRASLRAYRQKKQNEVHYRDQGSINQAESDYVREEKKKNGLLVTQEDLQKQQEQAAMYADMHNNFTLNVGTPYINPELAKRNPEMMRFIINNDARNLPEAIINGAMFSTVPNLTLSGIFGTLAANDIYNNGLNWGNGLTLGLSSLPIFGSAYRGFRSFGNNGYRNWVLSRAINSSAKNNVYLDIANTPRYLDSGGNAINYFDYLQTIFPNSKLRGIQWHGGDTSKLSSFRFNPDFNTNIGGFYTTPSKTYASQYGRTNPVLLNVENPLHTEGGWTGLLTESDINNITRAGYDGIINPKFDTGFRLTPSRQENIVFNPEQVHVLGSNNDYSGFIDYLNSNNKFSQSLWQNQWGTHWSPNPRMNYIFYERPSYLSDAERAGIPKGDRNNIVPYLEGSTSNVSEDIMLINRGKYPYIFKNGQIVWNPQKTGLGRGRRLTTHFTLDRPVTGHGAGNWDLASETMIVPYKQVVKLNGQPLNIEPMDTYFGGFGRFRLNQNDVKILTSDPVNYRKYKLAGVNAEFSEESNRLVTEGKKIEEQIEALLKKADYYPGNLPQEEFDLYYSLQDKLYDIQQKNYDLVLKWTEANGRRPTLEDMKIIENESGLESSTSEIGSTGIHNSLDKNITYHMAPATHANDFTSAFERWENLDFFDSPDYLYSPQRIKLFNEIKLKYPELFKESYKRGGKLNKS